jgi:hypothetical protein
MEGSNLVSTLEMRSLKRDEIGSLAAPFSETFPTALIPSSNHLMMESTYCCLVSRTSGLISSYLWIH